MRIHLIIISYMHQKKSNKKYLKSRNRKFLFDKQKYCTEKTKAQHRLRFYYNQASDSHEIVFFKGAFC